jgi:predicted flap endonuclease-1-like 5' DNA nuclease
VLAALLIGLATAWFVFRASRRTKITGGSDGDGAADTAGDVLDEGAAPAARNQALIDSAPAAQKLADPLKALEKKAEPVPTAAPAAAPKPAAGASADDLTQIKGVGKKLSAMLGEQGVTSFAQIAAWSEADINRIDPLLGRFSGRIRRDQWVTQAQFLADGDMTGFADEFGSVE